MATYNFQFGVSDAVSSFFHWVIISIPSDLPEVAVAVKAALTEAGSTNSDNFELKYNVDVLSPVVRHAESEVC